ncbi:2-hydroxyacid dehydrogenase [Pseudozobellia thermophila]|uniref:D-lactate dehydrogenase n=1 Tax=Pseudozobellia thermophila TaxID=192903 RepID=A0A1M6IN57_9FLAO|nr:2-hydroxyacid dehydrogenase [Pseudozobellia thermophila]SHJ35924.1 D-lactate dehydrogenase [Pseudozobellia thermophila]
MKVLIYSAKDFEIPFLRKANKGNHKITYLREALDSETALKAMGFEAVSIFSGDDASSLVLEKLWHLGVRYISLRSAGYNNINLNVAKKLGFRVANAPDYSPHAIAEHAVALLLALNRKLILANERVHRYNFVQNGLMGFNLHGKTLGIIGTGRIGSTMAGITHGFGCPILAHDPKPDYGLTERFNLTYTSLDEVCMNSDIISLHLPLSQENHHLIDAEKLALMKPGALLINTSRGALVDTKALIEALNKNQLKGYGADVYENERGVFFRDHSKNGIRDEQLKKLLSLPNVLLTPHQAFMTKEALARIAEITFVNIDAWADGLSTKNELDVEEISL